MKRDMELVRQILFAFEKREDALLRHFKELEVEGASPETIRNHVALMVDAGLVVRHSAMMKKGSDGRVEAGERVIQALRLSWEGHDFLDTIRDPEMWAKTKQGANAVKSWSLDTIKEIGKGLVKKQIEEFTGVKVG